MLLKSLGEEFYSKQKVKKQTPAKKMLGVAWNPGWAARAAQHKMPSDPRQFEEAAGALQGQTIAEEVEVEVSVVNGSIEARHWETWTDGHGLVQNGTKIPVERGSLTPARCNSVCQITHNRSHQYARACSLKPSTLHMPWACFFCSPHCDCRQLATSGQPRVL